MQIVSEVWVSVHCFQMHFLKQNTWSMARLDTVLLIQTVLYWSSSCGRLPGTALSETLVVPEQHKRESPAPALTAFVLGNWSAVVAVS